MFEAACDDGVDICFDVYPYDASSSSLTQYLPAVQAGGTEAMVDRLAVPTVRRRALDGGRMVRRHPVAVGLVPREQLPDGYGVAKTLAALADGEDVDPVSSPSGCASATATSCRSCSSTAEEDVTMFSPTRWR